MRGISEDLTYGELNSSRVGVWYAFGHHHSSSTPSSGRREWGWGMVVSPHLTVSGKQGAGVHRLLVLESGLPINDRLAALSLGIDSRTLTCRYGRGELPNY